jgi:hypothetical protein
LSWDYLALGVVGELERLDLGVRGLFSPILLFDFFLAGAFFFDLELIFI